MIGYDEHKLGAVLTGLLLSLCVLCLCDVCDYCSCSFSVVVVVIVVVGSKKTAKE
jgi:hypothetical protein